MTKRAGDPISFPQATTSIHEVGKGRVRTYECDTCGTVAQWGPGWEWYGSLLNIEGGLPPSMGGKKADPEPLVVTCSATCRGGPDVRE